MFLAAVGIERAIDVLVDDFTDNDTLTQASSSAQLAEEL